VGNGDMDRGPGGAGALIMDVGAHNGDDTGYYLHRGYRVVAVEANPVLAAQIRKRFTGTPLSVENVCIGAERSASVTFWVNRANSTWSSFYRELAAREGTEAIPVDVPSVTMGELLERHGVPHYLKIDIEGMDAECLRWPDPANLPRYVSLELTHGHDLIGSLERLGYRRFKVLNQTTYTTAEPIFSHEIGWRLLRKSRLGRLLPDGIKQDFDRFHANRGWVFREGCSGPFGEDTFGDWLTAERARRLHQRIQGHFMRGGWPLGDCWYDVHATV
jgi:FkbM family methyltransferase